MAEHYYVICFNDETKEWSHDCDTEDIRFDEGTIWDIEKEEWSKGYLGDLVWNEASIKADEIFGEGLTVLNQISAVFHLR